MCMHMNIWCAEGMQANLLRGRRLRSLSVAASRPAIRGRQLEEEKKEKRRRIEGKEKEKRRKREARGEQREEIGAERARVTCRLRA